MGGVFVCVRATESPLVFLSFALTASQIAETEGMTSYVMFAECDLAIGAN